VGSVAIRNVEEEVYVAAFKLKTVNCAEKAPI